MPLCDPLWRRKERAHDVTCYPPGFSPFLGELQPTPRGQYAAMQFWHSGRRDLTCFGSRPPFGPKHTQWDSCLESELASPWPPYPVVPEKQSCHILCGAWHCPGHTHLVSFKNPWCSASGWRFHPAPPVHSSYHGEWHPIPWLSYRP